MNAQLQASLVLLAIAIVGAASTIGALYFGWPWAGVALVLTIVALIGWLVYCSSAMEKR
jgi:hypothetical protein